MADVMRILSPHCRVIQLFYFTDKKKRSLGADEVERVGRQMRKKVGSKKGRQSSSLFILFFIGINNNKNCLVSAKQKTGR
jgi:hypothetical protein